MIIMLAGDTHGNSDHVAYLLAQAQKQSVDLVYQVGDWGFSWPSEMPQRWRGFQKLVKRYGVPFYFHEGNHDNYTWLKETGAWGSPVLFPLGPDVTYAPRGVTWEWDGVRFMAAGGGVSIDKSRRTLGHSFWEEETFKDEELRTVFAAGPVDVLLTHDSPNNPTLEKYLLSNGYNLGYKLDAESRFNRYQMDLVWQSAQPKLTVHGHYHHYYLDTNELTGQRIVGVNCDGRGRESYIILDTEKFKESHAHAGN